MNEEQVVVGERIAKEAPKRKNKKKKANHGLERTKIDNDDNNNSNEPNENANITRRYTEAEKNLVREKLPPAKMQEIARAKGYGDEPTEEQLFSIVDEVLAEEKAKLREQEAREFVHQPTELEKRKAHLLVSQLDELAKSRDPRKLKEVNMLIRNSQKNFQFSRAALNREVKFVIDSKYSKILRYDDASQQRLNLSFIEPSSTQRVTKTAKSSTTTRSMSPSSTQRPRKSTKSSVTQSRAKSPQPTRPSKIVKFRADDLDPDDLKADVPAKTADLETPVPKTYTKEDFNKAIHNVDSMSPMVAGRTGMKKQDIKSMLVTLRDSDNTELRNKVMSMLDRDSKFFLYLSQAVKLVLSSNDKAIIPYETRFDEFKNELNPWEAHFLNNFKKGDKLDIEARRELRNILYRQFTRDELIKGREKSMEIGRYLDEFLEPYGIKRKR